MNNSCINCRSRNLSNFFNLGKQPLSCKFPLKNDKDPRSYSLKLIICNTCKLVQIKNIVDPKKMYGTEYGYYSSLSALMKNHLKNIYLESRKFLEKGDSILDIGSNDGTLLNFFNIKKLNKVVGVDPNINLYGKNYKSGIHKIPTLFDKLVIKNDIINKNKFKIIFSIAMFYDVSNIHFFLKIIKKILKKNGIWIIELSYLKTLLQNMTYDQICHEHVAYYNLDSLGKILKKHDLDIFDCFENQINGGSIRLHIKHKINRLPTSQNFLKKKSLEDNFFKNYNDSFSSRVNASKLLIFDYLKILSKSKKIYGYGASTKGNIILNFINIDKNLVRKICDANPSKHGRVTPGSRIEIISKEQMRKDKPDYLFILIWSFRNEVIKQEVDYIKNGGKLIIPYPSVHIIDKSNYLFFLKRDITDFSYSY